MTQVPIYKSCSVHGIPKSNDQGAKNNSRNGNKEYVFNSEAVSKDLDLLHRLKIWKNIKLQRAHEVTSVNSLKSHLVLSIEEGVPC